MKVPFTLHRFFLFTLWWHPLVSRWVWLGWNRAKRSMMAWRLPPDFSWPHFGIAAGWGIHLRFVIWEDAILLFIISYIFLSSNVCPNWAANFIVFNFLFVFFSSNVCMTWAATFPAPSFFQRFILCCLSLSFSSCLFLPDLLHYVFPYLFICRTVKVIQISSIFNSKRINGISQYHYF